MRRRSLLFAGGIGVTPLLCMAQRLATIGADFALHYCTRSPERTAFLQEIARIGVCRPRAVPLRLRAARTRSWTSQSAVGDARRRHAALRVRPDRLHRSCGRHREGQWLEQRPDPPGILRRRAAGHLGRHGVRREDRQHRQDLYGRRRARAWSRPCRHTASRSSRPASRASAAPASRACWKASPTTATCTSPRKSARRTTSSPRAARAPGAGRWCSTCSAHRSASALL